MKKEKKTEQMLEQEHLDSCLQVINENIQSYEAKEESCKKEVKELFQSVKKGEGDSYGLLAAGQNILEHIQNSLRKNRAAQKKAYFGRIDYRDDTYGTSEICYIGKNGITKNQTDVVIVDWRAPVSSVYYENESGEGTYQVPGAEEIHIHLKKKRTYDIQENKLLGFYEDDAAANDELLVKYLSQNKEAVLGDIIATIQKEQNEIIRDIPFKNIIVQGVAGSGKTTVALHRISYLLYNYEDRYKPSEFCIVGGTDMLLNYISSGLPELDVNHVKQMRMDQFIPYLMGNAWKKKYRLIPEGKESAEKSKLWYVQYLEQFLEEWKNKALDLKDIRDEKLGLILSEENLRETMETSGHLSLLQMEKLFNQRLQSRIKFLCSDLDETVKKDKLQKYKRYFDSGKEKWTEPQLYKRFLNWMEEREDKSFLQTEKHLEKMEFDLYDTAALGLIWRRILQKKGKEEFSQIIIDEAQDFGEMLYYVLKSLTPDCYYTIMGDVSQNIRYETGMNDWDGLKQAIFTSERDSFYLLAKSYRNTIEISECAGKVLEKASCGIYKIQPVIRHGQPVHFIQGSSQDLLEELEKVLMTLKEKAYETIAVITRSEEEAGALRKRLKFTDEKQEEEFHNGIMVLPVMHTKGLEFDAVVLWKADNEHYGNNIKEGKLLYVAITRALHELYLLSDKAFSSLLS